MAKTNTTPAVRRHAQKGPTIPAELRGTVIKMGARAFTVSMPGTDPNIPLHDVARQAFVRAVSKTVHESAYGGKK